MTDASGREALIALLREVSLLQASIARVLVGSDPVGDRGPDLDADPDARRLAETIVGLRRVMVTHPAATRSVVRLLEDAGREYAATPEGAHWRRGLGSSPTMADLRLLWDATTSGLFDAGGPDERIPEAWTELLDDVLAARLDVETAMRDLSRGMGW